MSPAPDEVVWTYDDFTSDVLDPARWQVMRVRGPDGEHHTYQDPNSRLRTGDGHFELTVHPFSRFHDTEPIRNNAKQMYRSARRFAVPEHGRLRVDVTMAVRTYGQIPYDLLDAFGTVNLFDLDSGVVFNVAATNDTVYAVIERLPVPGVTSPQDRYVHRVVLQVPTQPGHEHDYAIVYDAGTSDAEWLVDGQRVYWARVPVPVRGFHAGMALFSARDLTRFARAERERGQGATGRWGPWRVSGCDIA